MEVDAARVSKTDASSIAILAGPEPADALEVFLGQCETAGGQVLVEVGDRGRAADGKDVRCAVIPCFVSGGARLDACVSDYLRAHLRTIQARIESLDEQQATTRLLQGLVVA